MKRTILVVDDELMTREMLRMMLELSGYAVTEAVDGEDALAKIDEVQPDMVLLDVMMPGVDGFEVCRRLRANEKTAHIPIVILSAKTAPDAVQKGLAAGANTYLKKPVTREELIEEVAARIGVSTPA